MAIDGKVVNELKHCGLKLYLFLSCFYNKQEWIVNPQEYANWLNIDYKVKSRTVRKSMNDAIINLIECGYIKIIDEDKYYFSTDKLKEK